MTVMINEVAWSGTAASSNDEWIELHNPGPTPIDLDGWVLSDGGDVNIHLRGTLPAYGFFLLERTDDTTILDLPADQIYTGALGNSGESLELFDPSGSAIDTAPGFGGVGRDAQGNAIGGTPRQPNAVDLPKPTATSVPSRLVINEVLIRPHYDWEGTGGVSPDDEFIELYNAGDLPVRLLGWMLDDVEAAGSKPYLLQDTVLPAYGFLTFFRSRTNVDLNDSGDTVRLLDPDGRVVDQTSFLKVRASNLSYGRLPDGGHHLRYGLWPTAGLPNQLFIESKLPLPILDDFTCPAGHLRPLLFRFPDHPLARLHASTPLFVCP